MPFEGLYDILAGDIDHFDAAVIRRGEQFAVVFDEGQISNQLIVGSQVEESFFVVNLVDNMYLSAIVPNSCEVSVSFLSDRQGSDEDLS